MQTNFNTSFIPEPPRSGPGAAMRSSGARVNIALVVALVIFFSTLATAGGMYFYRFSVEKTRDAKTEELAQKAKEIDIEVIRKFDYDKQRLDLAKGLLENHGSTLALLDVLQEETLKSVRFTQFDLTDKEGKPNLSLSGEAPSYMSVYLQEDAMKKLPVVTNVKLSALTLNEQRGFVSFMLSLELKPEAINYGKYLAAIAQKAAFASSSVPVLVATTSSQLP